MRRLRRALTPQQRRQSMQAAYRQLSRCVRLRAGMRIGVYLAAGGELETRPFIQYAQRRGCRIYVPVIRQRRTATMWFVPLQPPLQLNGLGIDEPQARAARRVDPRWLDLVLVPLLAFGPNGARLGFGAGFYDRAFAYLLNRQTWHKPHLVGLAYHWQLVSGLKAGPWDVPLPLVITDREIHRFDRPSHRQ